MEKANTGSVLKMTVFVCAVVLLFATTLGVTPASAGSQVVTGSVTIPAGGVFAILPPEPGKVFFGTLSARGVAAPGNDPSKYDFQGIVQGLVVHFTGPAAAGITHVTATRDQNAMFVGETLEIHNFSNSPTFGTPPGYDITVTFAVAFERKEAD